MTLIPEPQTWMGSETDVARLEQHLENLSAQYLEQFGETSLDDGKLVTIAKLYTGAKRLHEAIKEGGVADAVIEIGSNLIGCEQMAVILARGERNEVAFLASAGLKGSQLYSMRKKARAIIEEAGRVSVYMAGDGEEPDPLLSPLGIIAFVLFSLDDTTKGAIVLFDLLPQRESLDSSDRELFKLLSTYAGPCISADKVKVQETSR